MLRPFEQAGSVLGRAVAHGELPSDSLVSITQYLLATGPDVMLGHWKWSKGVKVRAAALA